MEKLAAQGLRYNRFHTTALCSPTRAALLTGRNHHVTGNGGITELATGYDGYTGILPRSAGTVAEIVRHAFRRHAQSDDRQLAREDHRQERVAQPVPSRH
jgi:arylsulfatase A-like enzyme